MLIKTKAVTINNSSLKMEDNYGNESNLCQNWQKSIADEN